MPPNASPNTSTHDADALEHQSQQYDENLDLIERYSYKESQQIKTMNASAATEAERRAVQELKGRLWASVKDLRDIENGIGMNRLVNQQLYVRMIGAISSAVLLNIPTGFLTLMGALFLYVYAGTVLGSSYFTWKAVDFEAYEQILQGYRSRLGSSAQD